jgi:hypothetical protein
LQHRPSVRTAIISVRTADACRTELAQAHAKDGRRRLRSAPYHCPSRVAWGPQQLGLHCASYRRLAFGRSQPALVPTSAPVRHLTLVIAGRRLRSARLFPATVRAAARGGFHESCIDWRTARARIERLRPAWSSAAAAMSLNSAALAGSGSEAGAPAIQRSAGSGHESKLTVPVAIS